MKQNVFHFVSIGFLLGILCSSYLKFGSYFLVFCFIIFGSALIFFIGREVVRKTQGKNKFLILISIGCILFLLGAFRLENAERILAESALKEFEEKVISVIGVVADEPQRKNEQLVFRLKTYAISEANNTRSIRPSFILLRTPFYRDINYGEKLLISGKLEAIRNFSADDGQFFDYVSYLKKDKVAYQIQRPEVEIVSSGEGNSVISTALFVKEKFIENISQSLSEPAASLVAGMVISGKQSLDKTLQEDFIKAGIIHVVVLSGYNIAIVVTVLLWLFSFTSRKIKLGIVCAGLILFVIMSGGSAPVVRAAVMALVILFAKFGGRQTSVTRVLILTAFVMVMWNPYILAFDSSFQLSFLATFAIIYVSPILKSRLSWVTEKYKLREIVSDTLGTQIFLLPFLIYKMGLVSLVALPVNILVLPLVPWIMFLGFVIGMFGFIPYITIPFALTAHLLVEIMLFIMKLFVSLPFSSISITRISIFIPIIIYIIFLVYILRLKVQKISV